MAVADKWDAGHPYRWRTWLRGRLPWFLINLGVAGGVNDFETTTFRI
jgi:hypothetical protein